MSNNRITWGQGAAKIVPKSTREETETVIVLPDCHFPYQNDDLIASAIRLIRRVKPHRVILLGDLMDFHSISRGNQEQERLDNLQEEIDEANKFLGNIRRAAPDSVINLIKGNHDDRLERYIAINARAITSLRALEWNRLIDVKPNSIHLHEGHGFLLRKTFLCKHGTRMSQIAGLAGKAEALAAGVNGISGHTHRLATYRQSGYQSLQWTEAGTLSRLDPNYFVGIPNGQPGAAIGFFSTKTDNFVLDLIQCYEGKLFYGGKAY